jgi:diguanylate cyclase (GGDEF)-like protein
MDSTITAYITLVCVSGVLNLFLGLYVFLKRHLYANISTFFILSTAAEAIYCFGYAFSLTSSTLEQLRFWSVVQYFGMPFAPPLGLLFVLKYFGYNITKSRVAAMLAIPVLSLLSNATNEFHHLHYKEYQIHETLGAPHNDIEVGVTYIIHGSFLFLCFISSLLLLLSRWRDTNWAYRPQLFSLIGAHLIPMATSFLYLIGVTPAGIDPVPMVVGVTSILMWWTIESSRLLTIIPIAKETIFHSISDGVIVLDKPGRPVEFNDSCRHMFHRLNRSMFGQPLEEVWPVLFGSSTPAVPKLDAKPQELEVVASEPEERIYQVRVSPLKQKEHCNWTGTVMIIADITEIKRLQRKLEQHAYYDELTQIFNRRAFFERCEEGYTRSKQDASAFTAILFDIDHFKKINDTYGHNAGDQVLMHVVHICKSCLTDNVLFARYGGEEFVLALFGRTAAQGKDFAERLRENIASHPLSVEGKVIHVTSSFGVAESSGRADESLQNLLHFADEALYAAKRAGRNQVCVFTG